MPAFHLSGDLPVFPGYDISTANYEAAMSLDLLDVKWLRFDLGSYYYKYGYYDSNGFMFGGDLFLTIPNDYFIPFVGAGCYTSKDFDKVTVPLKAGFSLANFLEFTYEISLEDINTSNMYITDKYSLGIRLPLSTRKYAIKPTETYASISEPEIIDGKDYKLKKTTTELRLYSPVVKGFEGKSEINNVFLSDNVEVIEENAFANMENLSRIIIGEGLTTIKSQAFLNDTELRPITLPETVVTIEKGAFSGWYGSQTIHLQWTSDDETPRDLSGLNDTFAYVIFMDGVVYEKK